MTKRKVRADGLKIVYMSKWTEFYYYDDLPKKYQKENSDLQYDNFVKYRRDYIPLSSFQRTQNTKPFHGIHPFTYDSALFIELNRSGDGYRLAYGYYS